MYRWVRLRKYVYIFDCELTVSVHVCVYVSYKYLEGFIAKIHAIVVLHLVIDLGSV